MDFFRFITRIFQKRRPCPPTAMTDGQFGRWAEDQAVKYLKHKGMKILARNYRKAVGELDIIAQQEDTIVFVEVKAVRTPGADPQLRVDRAKQRRLFNTAKSFIARYNLYEKPARFDIITLVVTRDDTVEIEHEPDAFTAPS